MLKKPEQTRRGVLPGFGLTLGFTVLYLSLIVLIPLSAIFLKTASLSWEQFWSTVAAPRAARPAEATGSAGSRPRASCKRDSQAAITAPW